MFCEIGVARWFRCTFAPPNKVRGHGVSDGYFIGETKGAEMGELLNGRRDRGHPLNVLSIGLIRTSVRGFVKHASLTIFGRFFPVTMHRHSEKSTVRRTFNDLSSAIRIDCKRRNCAGSTRQPIKRTAYLAQLTHHFPVCL